MCLADVYCETSSVQRSSSLGHISWCQEGSVTAYNMQSQYEQEAVQRQWVCDAPPPRDQSVENMTPSPYSVENREHAPCGEYDTPPLENGDVGPPQKSSNIRGQPAVSNH